MSTQAFRAVIIALALTFLVQYYMASRHSYHFQVIEGFAVPTVRVDRYTGAIDVLRNGQWVRAFVAQPSPAPTDLKGWKIIEGQELVNQGTPQKR